MNILTSLYSINEQAVVADKVESIRKAGFIDRDGISIPTINFNMESGNWCSWRYRSEQDRDAEWIRLTEMPVFNKTAGEDHE